MDEHFKVEILDIFYDYEYVKEHHVLITKAKKTILILEMILIYHFIYFYHFTEQSPIFTFLPIPILCHKIYKNNYIADIAYFQ